MTHDIFVSYRREGGVDLAARIKDALKAKGYSVFMDIEDLKSGKFNVALLNKIAEATDVLVILTPGCLERCRNEGDWLLREVEHAIRLERNVVPVMTPSFIRPAVGELPSVIYDLLEYHGIKSQPEMFDESVARLTLLLKSNPVQIEKPAADSGGETVETGHPWPGTVHAPSLARPGPERMAVLKIVSDPPGAYVVIDGCHDTSDGKFLTKVAWGAHDYFATLGDEESFGSFEINVNPYILRIPFPVTLARIAEAAAEEALWSRTVATDTEKAYGAYVTETRSRTHRVEADRKLEAFRAARALKERAERQRLEKEAAKERARQEAEARRLAEEQRIAEEKRLAKEKRAANARRAAEAKRMAEAKRIAEELRVADEQRRQKYLVAVAAAEAAFKKQDYASAAGETEKALELFPAGDDALYLEKKLQPTLEVRSVLEGWAIAGAMIAFSGRATEYKTPALFQVERGKRYEVSVSLSAKGGWSYSPASQTFVVDWHGARVWTARLGEGVNP
jgi:hypothetical protein